MRERLTAALRKAMVALRGLRQPSLHRRDQTSLLNSLDLSFDQQEIAERIWHSLSDKTGSPDCDRVIGLALHRLRTDLHSEERAEVIEELRREIEFGDWSDELVKAYLNKTCVVKVPHMD